MYVYPADRDLADGQGEEALGGAGVLRPGPDTRNLTRLAETRLAQNSLD